MYKVISFGHRCTSASFLQLLNLKTESYPFDWLVSKLDVVKDCIETNFVHFLNVNNYITTQSETVNIIDNETIFYCNEIVNVNMYYQTDLDNRQTFNYKLALNHHNMNSDYEYYQRCINRLNDLFESDIQKYYIHFCNILGINDFENKKDTILEEFYNFNDFILKKTKNIFGIYFIPVKHDESVKSIKLIETQNYVVFLLYCNKNFLDFGYLFSEDFEKEKEEVLSILKNIFM